MAGFSRQQSLDKISQNKKTSQALPILKEKAVFFNFGNAYDNKSILEKANRYV